MKTFNHKSRTRERVMAPSAWTDPNGRKARRAEQRKAERAERKARARERVKANPRLVRA
jgi:hypothetical protein